jgi:hypothetical protein
MIKIPIFLTNTKSLSIIVASLLTLGGMTAAGVLNTNEEPVIFSGSEDGFKNVIKDDAQDIYNAVNNVLTGREYPETVKKMIITEYRGTQRDSTYSPEEIEINTQYQAFLTEAYSVLEVYAAGQAPDLKKMNAAKAKLS